MSDVLTRSSSRIATRVAPTDAVEGFFARLMALPLAEWFACATMPERHDAAASRTLGAAVSTPEMLFSAWLVRDRVNTAMYRFESPEGRHLCSRARASDVSAATARAAEALLVRFHLTAAEFDVLYGGFATALPV